MKPDDPLSEPMSRLAPPPPPDPAARERALYHATLALRGARGATREPSHAWVGGNVWWWGGQVTATVVIVVLLVGFIRLWTVTKQEIPSLPDERVMLGQMEILFGTQLDAVVEHAGTAPDVRVSPGSGAAASLMQPVLIEFDRAGAPTTRVLSYSGRNVCVMLGGRRMCFEPLVTGQGDVMLNGERFCWTPGQSLDGYRVTARRLSPRI